MFNETWSDKVNKINNVIKRQCKTCKYWMPYIDNGQCDLDSRYCEFDDKCKNYKNILFK